MANNNMDEYCGRFRLVADMNSDLAVTVTDVWQWITFFFQFPAKLVVSVLHQSDKLATFFEVNCATGEGIGGGVFSALAWLLIAAIVGSSLK